MFLVFEGADGVGKTTHADRLAERLRALGHGVVRLHEPTRGRFGQRIRAAAKSGQRPDPETELAWFVADREHDVRDNILPALARGAVVVLDRYFYSTVAYQSVRGLARAEILARNRRFAPEPDLGFVLACSPELAQERIGARGDTPDAFEALDEQRQIAGVFAALAAEHDRLVAIDTAGPVEQTAEAIWAALAEHCPALTRPRDGLHHA